MMPVRKAGGMVMAAFLLAAFLGETGVLEEAKGAGDRSYPTGQEAREHSDEGQGLLFFPEDTLSVVTSQGKTETFTVEIASTDLQRRQGLMNRTTLAEDAGMLFVFPFPQPVAMWMKDTLVPLDMLYIDVRGIIVRIEYQVAPNSLIPRHSGGDVLAVLELAGGVAKKRGLSVGDQVRYPIFLSFEGEPSLAR